MEEILKVANELGIMIQGTDVYRKFQAALVELDRDEASVRLLEEYTACAEDIQNRRKNGDIIEAFEKRRMEELMAAVRESTLLMRFISARDAYMDLLMQIHDAIEPGGPAE